MSRTKQTEQTKQADPVIQHPLELLRKSEPKLKPRETRYEVWRCLTSNDPDPFYGKRYYGAFLAGPMDDIVAKAREVVKQFGLSDPNPRHFDIFIPVGQFSVAPTTTEKKGAKCT